MLYFKLETFLIITVYGMEVYDITKKELEDFLSELQLEELATVSEIASGGISEQELDDFLLQVLGDPETTEYLERLVAENAPLAEPIWEAV